MGVLDRIEDEYLDVSTSRATVRELLELVIGAAIFLAVAVGLSWFLLGRQVAFWLGVLLSAVFVITIASQAYWAVTGRGDYGE